MDFVFPDRLFLATEEPDTKEMRQTRQMLFDDLNYEFGVQ